MKSEVLANFQDVWLTSSALILFFTVFVGVSILAWKKTSSEKFKQMENLPFDEGRKK